MRIWQCVKKLVAEIIYLIVNVMYLILLNQLNKELRLQNLNALKLLMYDGYIALKFFGVAILLFGIGCYLLRRRIKIIKTDSDCWEEVLASIIAILILIVLLILLIIYINNPILQAIFTVGIMGLCGMSLAE